MTIGRVLINGKYKGSGFALATSSSGPTRIVLTAYHVVRGQEASALEFAIAGGRSIAIERIEPDEDLDVAILHLSEDVPQGLMVGRASEEANWQVEARPLNNDPKLHGTVTDTRRPFVTEKGEHEIHVLQLHVKENLGDYQGYSGSPVVLTSPPGAVIGVLDEHLRSRLVGQLGQRQPATNVLYAIPIHDVLERFALPVLWAAPMEKVQYIQTFTSLLRPAPLSYRSAVLRMVEDYVTIFGGRDTELTALNAFLTQESQSCALLLAPTGRGKTALLIHWLAQVQAEGQWTVIFAPISQRYQTANAQQTLAMLAQALAAFHGEQLQDYSMSPDLLRPAIANYLRRDPPVGKRLLLLLDGLDEAVGWNVDRNLFPRTIGSHLRIIATARDLAQKTRDDWLAELGWATQETTELSLPLLSRAAIADILQQMGSPLDVLATDKDVLDELLRVSEGDPLTIKFLVEGLKDGSETADHMSRRPAGLEAYIQDWLKELQQHTAQFDAIYQLLGLCAVAHGPLTSNDLQKLAPEQFTRLVKLREAVRQVARFVIGDGSEDRGYTFNHPRLRELFLETELSPPERYELRQRFVQYGQTWYGNRQGPLSVYLRNFWIVHLTEVDAWQVVRTVLSEIVQVDERYQQPWASTRYAAEASYIGYLSDVDLLWKHIEQRRDVVLGLCCALIAASLFSLSSNLPPDLLVKLVTVGTPEGKWSPIAALEHIRQMSNPRQQTEALKKLIAAGCKLPWEEALEVANKITNRMYCSEALGMLASSVPAEQRSSVYDEALEAARNAYERAEALEKLAPYMPVEQQPSVYDEALEAARNVSYAPEFVKVLERLVPYLSTEKLLQAVNVIQTLNNSTWLGTSDSDEARIRALKLIASYLPTEQRAAIYTQALSIVQAMTDEYGRVTALLELAPRLLLEQQSAIYAQVLEAATQVTTPTTGNFENAIVSRARALVDLAPHLSLEQQPAIYAQALETIQTINGGKPPIRILEAIAPQLPPLERSKAHSQILVVLESMSSRHEAGFEYSFAWTLKGIGADLPSSLLPEVMRMIQNMVNPEARARAWANIVPSLPVEQRSDVLLAAMKITETLEKNYPLFITLMDLAPNLPAEQQSATYTQALAIALAIPDDDQDTRNRRGPGPQTRMSALMWLAPYLLPKQQPLAYAQALEVAQIIADNKERIRVLGLIVPHLPATQQAPMLERLLEAAQAIVDSEISTRTLILGSLAAYVSPEQQLALFNQTLDTVEKNTGSAVMNDSSRAELMTSLLQSLPLTLPPKVLRAAITESGIYVETLRAIAPHLAPELVAQALNAISSVSYSQQDRALALEVLAPYLKSELSVQALEIATSLSDPWWRARALEGLSTHLPSLMLPEVLAELQDINSNRGLVRVIAPLLPRLSFEQQREIVDIVKNISDEGTRVQALESLVPLLATELLPQVLPVVLTIADDVTRRRLLIVGGLTSLLSPEERSKTYTQALQTALMPTDYAWKRVRSLVELLPHFPAEQKLGIYIQALDAIWADGDASGVAQDFVNLIPHLPSTLFSQALQLAQSLTKDSYGRSIILGKLVSYLPPEQQAKVYGQVLTALPSIRFGGGLPRIQVLEELLTHLPPALFPQALQTVQVFPEESNRAQALEKLAPYLVSKFSNSSTEGVDLWLVTIRSFATYGRPHFLNCLASLSPWFISLASSQTLIEVVAIIDEVSLCWP